MSEDTRPDGHHSKNHLPKPNKQGSTRETGVPRNDTVDYLRGTQRTGHKVWIKNKTGDS